MDIRRKYLDILLSLTYLGLNTAQCIAQTNLQDKTILQVVHNKKN